MTDWVNWTSVSRQAGSPIDVAFLTNWRARLRSLRNQAAITWEYEEDIAVTTTSATAGTGNFPLWIPPWADRLICPVSVKMDVDDTGALTAGTGYYRILFDSVAVAEVRLILNCKIGTGPPPFCNGTAPGADGTPAESGLWFSKSDTIDVTAYRDSVVDITTEVQASSIDNIDSLGLRFGGIISKWNWQEAA